jgi:hypothetical protein
MYTYSVHEVRYLFNHGRVGGRWDVGHRDRPTSPTVRRKMVKKTGANKILTILYAVKVPA